MNPKIYFEYCTDWIKENRPQQIILIQNIISGCLELDAELVCIPTTYPSYGIKRLNSSHLLISYHSFSNPENVICYKEAPINGLFSIDQCGYAGWSDISLNLDQHLPKIRNISKVDIKNTLKLFREQLLNGDSKHPQLVENCHLPQKYIFFPLQVRTDSVAQHSNLDMAEVLLKVSTFAFKYKKHIVVKLHPHCNSEVIKAIQFIETEENPYFHTSSAHIIKLIQNADKIIACNSGASLEALILGKDVSCFGLSEWYHITNNIKTFDDLEKVFTDSFISQLTFFQEQYLTYLLKDYWVKYNDKMTICQRLKLIINNASFNQSQSYDLYSELTTNLLKKQEELTTKQNSIELVEKDFKYMQQILNYFRHRPWKVLKFFFKDRVIRLKRRR